MKIRIKLLGLLLCSSLFCFSQINVTIKWTAKCGTGAVRTASPAISSDNNVIYFGSGEDNKLYAINRDGSTKWTFDLSKDGANGIQNNSSPSVGEDGTIYMMNKGNNSDSGYFYAVNPDGNEKWKYNTGDLATSRPNYITPTIMKNGNIILGTRTGLHLVDKNTGEKISQTAVGTYGTVVVTQDNVAYLTSANNGIYSYDMNAIAEDQSALLKGQYKINNASYYTSGALAVDLQGNIIGAAGSGRIFSINDKLLQNWLYPNDSELSKIEQSGVAIGIDGTLYVSGSENKKMYAINPNGTIKWIYNTIGIIQCVPAIDNLGNIHIVDCDGNYYIIKDNVTDPIELFCGILSTGGISIASNGGWTSPLIAGDGLIYTSFSTSDGNVTLFCLEVSGVSGYSTNSAWPMKCGNPQRTGLQKKVDSGTFIDSNKFNPINIICQDKSLEIISQEKGQLLIYDLWGSLIYSNFITEGKYCINNLKSHIYLIKFGSSVKKIIL